MILNNELLSSVDSAWLAMETPDNLMMVCGILTFREPLGFKDLTAVVRRRFLQAKRFRQRLVHPQIPFAPAHWSPAFWEADPDFDLAHHLHEVELPAPATRGRLRDLINDLISTPLDEAFPLWDMHLIHGFEGGSVLLERTHHCIADGIGQIRMQLSMCDENPTAPPEPDPDAHTDLLDMDRDDTSGETRLQDPSPIDEAIHLYGKFLKETVRAISHPGTALQTGAEGAQTLSRLIQQDNDPDTLFKGPLGTDKRVAWSTPIPLDQVRRMKETLGGTINDVLVCAVAGGLRRYLEQKKAPVEDLDIRAAIPVNLRDPEDTQSLGNKFGLVFLSLPVGIADPVARLAELRTRMDELKGSPEAPLFYGLLRLLGHSHPKLQTPIVNILADKITAVMSNVRGPAKQLYFAGQPVEHMMFFVPQAGRVGLGISMFSYNDRVVIGINTDGGLVPDPELIVDGLLDEFAAMREQCPGDVLS